MTIHSTAIIDDSAKIHPSAVIGAYCIVGANVCIGENTRLLRHVVVGENTTIGKNNEIYQFASIGETPQDLKYAGEPTYLEIGDNNRIREACTIHRGTGEAGGLTKIGNNNLLMVNTHVAHDCRIGNYNVIANNVGIAGHVIIDDFAIIGGNSGIHQFCRIGSYSMTAGASLILKDVCAFVMVGGNPAKAKGLNKEGMRRKGWSKTTIETLEEAYRIMFRSGLIKDEAMARLETLVQQEPKVALMIESLRLSERGLVR